MDMIYRRKRITNKLEYGIWSFDRRGPKGAPRIFARCSRCGKTNDMTGGVFIAQYDDGKCISAKSGCAACMSCGRSFSEWTFKQWVPTLAFLTFGGYNFGGKAPTEIAKAVSAFKGFGYAYLWANALAIGTISTAQLPEPRSGQVSFNSNGRWTVATNKYHQKIFDLDGFNEAITILVEYLHTGAFISPATVPTPVVV